jgi:hypothetical protein
LLREWNRGCQPEWSERDLEHKIRSAASAPHDRPRGHLLRPSTRFLTFSPRKPAPSRPKIDPATAAENYLKKFGSGECIEAEVWEASPIRPPEDWTEDGIALLSALYRPGELINIVTTYQLGTLADGSTKARPTGIGTTLERDEWISSGKLSEQSEAGAWIRMNPVDGAGVADANVTAFRFALLESDELPPALQLRLFARLPLPIAAILTSGARSLHAWVKVDATSLDDYRATVARMLVLLAPFGIDRKNKNPGRLSRLVGVIRKLGSIGDGRQRLVYLNPSPTGRRIVQ